MSSAAAFNQSTSDEAPASRQFATFSLDRYYFGVEVLMVQEVIRYQDMTRVPLAHGVVQGLINLRGQIVTAVDLRRRLELPDRAEGVQPMNVVVRTSDGAMITLQHPVGEAVTYDDVVRVSIDPVPVLARVAS